MPTATSATRASEMACDETSSTAVVLPESRTSPSQRCSSGASGVVRVGLVVAWSMPANSLHEKALDMPERCRQAAVINVHVVLALVPVMPIMAMSLEGNPWRRAELSDMARRSSFTSSTGTPWARSSSTNSALGLLQHTATAPSSTALRTAAGARLAPSRLMCRSPGRVGSRLQVTPW